MKFVPKLIRTNPVALAIWRTFKDPYFEKIPATIAAALPKWQSQLVVQIGTNDGQRDDPVFQVLQSRRRWRALLVEPIPKYFETLVSNYGIEPRFMFENSAVGSTSGYLDFFHIDESARQSPHWRDYFDRIGSLNRSDLIINLGDKAEFMRPYIKVDKVNVLTVEQLLSKHGIQTIDALVVDAEGYDWEIVKQTLELGLKPKVILFEHSHLSAVDARVARRIIGEHYRLQEFDRDLLGIRGS